MPEGDGSDVLADALHDAAEDENVVKDAEKDQDLVEDAVQLLGDEDRDGEAVAKDPDQANDDLTDALQREGQLIVQGHLGVAGAIAGVGGGGEVEAGDGRR